MLPGLPPASSVFTDAALRPLAAPVVQLSTDVTVGGMTGPASAPPELLPPWLKTPPPLLPLPPPPSSCPDAAPESSPPEGPPLLLSPASPPDLVDPHATITARTTHGRAPR